MTRPLIEQWFPAATVGAESLRERGSVEAYRRSTSSTCGGLGGR